MTNPELYKIHVNQKDIILRAQIMGGGGESVLKLE